MIVGRLPPLLLCPGNFSGAFSLLNFGGGCVSGLSSLTKKHHYKVVVSKIFYFHSYLGKISNLTNIFQMVSNHQPDKAPYQINNQREFWSLGETAKMDLRGGPCHQLLNVVITAPLIGVIPLVTYLSFGHLKGPCGGCF